MKITKRMFLELRWAIAAFGVVTGVFTQTWAWGVGGVLIWFIFSIVAKIVKEIDVVVKKENKVKKPKKEPKG